MLLTEFYLILNCGVKLGTETNFTRERGEKNLLGLENGFIFEKPGDSFQPGIQQE